MKLRTVCMFLLMAHGLPVRAIPPPEPLSAYFTRADLVLVGELAPWRRTSWFWQEPVIYETSVKVETVLKGKAPSGELRFRILVYPEHAGGDLAGTPDTGRRLLFLRLRKTGHLEPISPAPYAFQDPSEANVAQLRGLAPAP